MEMHKVVRLAAAMLISIFTVGAWVAKPSPAGAVPDIQKKVLDAVRAQIPDNISSSLEVPAIMLAVVSQGGPNNQDMVSKLIGKWTAPESNYPDWTIIAGPRPHTFLIKLPDGSLGSGSCDDNAGTCLIACENWGGDITFLPDGSLLLSDDKDGKKPLATYVHPGWSIRFKFERR